MDWGADQWLNWLKREGNPPAPSIRALRDCEAALRDEISKLRARVAELEES